MWLLSIKFLGVTLPHMNIISALIYTIKFTLVAVIVKNVVSLALALMVRRIGKGK